MPIINLQIKYPDRMDRLVQTNLHDLARDLRSRGIECNLQTFESEEELASSLLNHADGPEQIYEEQAAND
jgi:hypothetical protein